MQIPYFSDNAFKKMKQAIDDGVDMNAVWLKHRPAGKRVAAVAAVPA